MQITVLDGFTINPGDNPWDPLEQLGDLTVFSRTAPEQVVERAAHAQIILTNKTPLSSDAIDQLAQLRFISVLATGYDVIDAAAARRRGICVSNVPQYGSDTVAQHVFAVLLSLLHRPHNHDAAVRAGYWEECGDFSFWLAPLLELTDKTLGIVGFGCIGQRVGQIGHAFGMRVLAYDVCQVATPPYRPFGWCGLEQLFSQSDVISLHCPLSPDTTQFVNADLLSRVKPGCILINAARGELVSEQDLADALNSDRLAGACLDVFSVEPIRQDNPLLHAKNCLLTPHYAWASQAARRRLMQATAENIRAFQQGQPINVVN